MANQILTKSDVFDLTGKMTSFRIEKFLTRTPDREYFWWEKDEECLIGGYTEHPENGPQVMVYYGKDFYDIEGFGLDELSSWVNLPTGLATADRRHGYLSAECVA